MACEAVLNLQKITSYFFLNLFISFYLSVCIFLLFFLWQLVSAVNCRCNTMSPAGRVACSCPTGRIMTLLIVIPFNMTPLASSTAPEGVAAPRGTRPELPARQHVHSAGLIAIIKWHFNRGSFNSANKKERWKRRRRRGGGAARGFTMCNHLNCRRILALSAPPP